MYMPSVVDVPIATRRDTSIILLGALNRADWKITGGRQPDKCQVVVNNGDMDPLRPFVPLDPRVATFFKRKHACSIFEHLPRAQTDRQTLPSPFH